VYVTSAAKAGRDAGDLCDMLSSGTNVVTTRGDFHHPACDASQG